MTFTSSADSGFTLQMGASSSVGGQNDGFRPMELLLMGLGGCTAMDVISILRKKRQDVTGFDILVSDYDESSFEGSADRSQSC